MSDISTIEITETSQRLFPVTYPISSYWWEVFPALRSLLQERGLDSQINEVSSYLMSFEYLKPNSLGISFSKTSEAYCLTMTGGLSKGFSMNWEDLGMSFNGFYLTLNTLESLNNGSVSTLSEILEENPHERFSISEAAMKGMIRRSLKWARGGYVLLQEQEPDRTRHQKPTSDIPSPLAKGLSETASLKRLSVTALPQRIEELAKCGMRLTLRELTPLEKERMQGFPDGWTELEEKPSETLSQ
jgi:hypothetical protein